MPIKLQGIWKHVQRELLPMLVDEYGCLSEKDRQFVEIVALLPQGQFSHYYDRNPFGRPRSQRVWILRAFIAKVVYGFSGAEALLENLHARPTLRRLCGWEHPGQIPSASTFSRAFAEFSENELIQKIHAELIKIQCAPKLVGHISRDSTAIEVRERPAPKAAPVAATPRKTGRPKKGEVRPPLSRLPLQLTRSLDENLADLPTTCDSGCKTNSKGHNQWWRGYKLHWDVIDGDIPISALLTSASLHDSQAAIPLIQMSSQRVQALYELMDKAYDAEAIRQQVQRSGRIAIIDPIKRPGVLPLDPAQQRRYAERTATERANARLKDEFGGRYIRVRGAAKVMTHLMFGVLVIAALGIWQRLC